MRWKSGFLFFVLVSAFVADAQNCFGQAATASATVSGSVTDNTQAIIVGAEVTLSNRNTGDRRSATTNDQGFYRFDLVSPGSYVIKVTKQGFASQSSQPIDVMVGQHATVNLALQPGSVAEQVIVTTEAPAVDAQKSDVSMNITPKQIQSIPLNGRDVGNLAVLAPSARPANSYDPTKSRVAVFSVNGSQGRNVNVTVNGVDNKDNGVGGPVMQLSLNAVQEFAISTQRFSAANGRSEGAAINVITKQGTNSIHGGVQFFDSETALNANDYFSKINHAPTPDFSRQQFR